MTRQQSHRRSSARPNAKRRAACASHAPSEGATTPPRTCIVCHAVHRKNQLLSMSVQHGVLQFAGPSSRHHERGTYVCIARACLQQVDAKALQRSARRGRQQFTGVDQDVQTALDGLHALAQQRVLETIGLARRMGALIVGVDTIAAQVGSAPDNAGCVIAAADLAARSARRVATANIFLLSEHMGRAAGMGSVGMMRIPPGRLAQEAAYWLAVWYETATNKQATEQQRDNAEAAEQAPVSARGNPPPTSENNACMQVF